MTKSSKSKTNNTKQGKSSRKGGIKKKQISKRGLRLILGGFVFLFIICVVLCVIFLIPHYTLSINNAKEIDHRDTDNISRIVGEIEVNCALSKQDGYYTCEKFNITGSYESNRKVSMTVDNSGELTTSSDGQFSLMGEYVKIKEVAIRDNEITTPIESTYTIELRDSESGGKKVEYNLKVKTILSSEDLALLNTENPDTSLIKTSLETIDTVEEACIVNENNDPNGKIGKQGHYYIKLVFKDKRLPAETIMMDNETMTTRAPRDVCEMGAKVGGTIEIYKEADRAETRKAELDAMLGTFFDSGPSEIIGKKSVIRVSSDLKASEQNTLLENMKKALTE